MITAVAMVIAPANIPGETGTFKLMVNVSYPSTISSSITVMFTVLLLVPAVMITFCVVDLKSTLLPKNTDALYTVSNKIVMCNNYVICISMYHVIIVELKSVLLPKE